MGLNSAPRFFSRRGRREKNNDEVQKIKGVKKLTPALLEEIIDCARGAFNYSEEKQKEFLENVLRRGGSVYYVRGSDSRVIGVGASEKTVWTDKEALNERGKTGFFFSNAVVREENRRQGIYSRLNTARIEDALRKKAAYIYTGT